MELPNTIEGLVRLEDMKDDYYIYDEKNVKLIGKRTKREFKMCDSISVRVLSSNKMLRRIDFELVI